MGISKEGFYLNLCLDVIALACTPRKWRSLTKLYQLGNIKIFGVFPNRFCFTVREESLENSIKLAYRGWQNKCNWLQNSYGPCILVNTLLSAMQATSVRSLNIGIKWHWASSGHYSLKDYQIFSPVQRETCNLLLPINTTETESQQVSPFSFWQQVNWVYVS